MKVIVTNQTKTYIYNAGRLLVLCKIIADARRPGPMALRKQGGRRAARLVSYSDLHYGTLRYWQNMNILFRSLLKYAPSV